MLLMRAYLLLSPDIPSSALCCGQQGNVIYFLFFFIHICSVANKRSNDCPEITNDNIMLYNERYNHPLFFTNPFNLVQDTKNPWLSSMGILVVENVVYRHLTFVPLL